MITSRTVVSLLILAVLSMCAASTAATLGTAFTYQGRLTNSAGAPLSGSYDMTFKLFDAESAGNLIGSAVSLPSVNVMGGIFSVQLDFGTAAFTGDKRWLETTVGTEVLSPRTEITSTPNAIFARQVPWEGVIGAPTFDFSGAAGGDLTGNYPNPTIANNAVTSEKISLFAVGTDHIQNGAIISDKIAPRAVCNENINDWAVDGSKLAFFAVGTDHIQGGAITCDKIAPNAVGTEQIQDRSVDTPKIGLCAVGMDQIKGGAITCDKIAPNAVGTEQIQDYSVDGSKIGLCAIGTDQIKGGAITCDRIAPNAVGTEQIQDRSVDTPKIGLFAVGMDQIKGGAITCDKIAPNAVGTEQIQDCSVDGSKIGLFAIGTDQIKGGAVTAANIADDTINHYNLASDADSLYKVSGGMMQSTYNFTVAPGGGLYYAPNAIQLTGSLLATGHIRSDGSLSINGDISTDTGNITVNAGGIHADNGSINGRDLVASHMIYGEWAGTSSDLRLKTDIQPLGFGLETIGSLRPVSYNWRTREFPDREFSEERQIGFIAQEVKDVLPCLVTQDDKGYYALDYSRITAVLVQAVQEQQTQIKERDARIKSLEDRLDRLEKLVSEQSGTR